MANAIRIEIAEPVRLRHWLSQTDLSQTENIRLRSVPRADFYLHGVRDRLRFRGRIRCKKGRPVFYSKSLTDQILNGWVESAYAIRHGRNDQKCDYELAVFVPHGYKKCRDPDRERRRSWSDAHQARIKNSRPAYDPADELPF